MSDIDRKFSDICRQSNTPIYSRILDIQNCSYESKGKKLNWRFIEESRKRKHDANHGKIELRYVSAPEGYIAVSCPWDLPASENKANGKYYISRSRGIEIKMPQDVVLDRVTKFASQEHYPFWIDKLCIDQRDGSDEKEIAIQSMDLVYKQSVMSLGLLFVRLDERKQLDRLHALLHSRYVTENKDRNENVQYILITSIKEARAVLCVVESIVKDSWWDRAWIFQEEYLSQLYMKLLIRSSVFRDDRQSKTFGNIPYELQIVATEFRTEATKLCLAIHRDPKASKDDKRRCEKVLKRAGKYSILHTQEKMPLGKTIHAMSPVIFEDIGRRGITNEWDILPIASNTCDYSKRLDTRKLLGRKQEQNHSLSLAILTTYIQNGEILSHDSVQGSCCDSSVFKFLEEITLPVNPPLGKEKALTFIKHCRFPNITLHRDGMSTDGIIWKLGKGVQPSHIWRKSASRGRKNIQKFESSGFKYHLDDYEIRALWRLYHWLRYNKESSYVHLAECLCNFLKNVAWEGYNEDWTDRHVMSIMATNVARAIQENKQLRLGCVDRSDRSPYSAIFVRDGTEPDYECSVFTSWSSAKEIAKGERLAISCAKYASLEISLSKRNKKPPMIEPRRWINGLCFFSNDYAQRVVIPWPKSLGG